jgi:hypothetical protein
MDHPIEAYLDMLPYCLVQPLIDSGIIAKGAIAWQKLYRGESSKKGELACSPFLLNHPPSSH